MEGQENEELFIKVKSGDMVLVGENQIFKMLSFVGVSRDLDAPTLLQLANVHSGEIHEIHVKEVTEIVSEYRTTIKNPLHFLSKYLSNINETI